jgi:(4-alkanoyl-5-oxo-2,5-dihydrofuran-3-yl)methyl phosphate reductase
MTTLLITGATGNVGGRVTEQLIAAGHRPRVLARDAAKARARFGDRVDVAGGDLADAASLHAALDGVERVFSVNVGPEIAGRDLALATAARAAGVRHLVKLSSFGAQRDQSGLGAWHAQGEASMRASGVAWTFVRPGAFMTNCLAWAPTIKAQGAVFSATRDGRLASIDTDDVAAVSVAALTQSGHEGRAYDLTGYEALSHSEMAAAIGRAIGRTLVVRPITDENVRENLARSGMPPAIVDALAEFPRLIRAGGMATITDDFERVLGRKPRSFAAWADTNAALFR